MQEIPILLADELSFELFYLGGGVGAGGAKVELDLGLCAGRTDGDNVTGLVEELEDVALGKAGFLRLVVVYDLGKGAAGDDLGRACTVIGHDLLNFLRAGFTLADDVYHLLYVQTVFFIYFLKELPEGEALLCGPCGAFCNGATCYLGALVTDKLSKVEAVAFLSAADELGLAFLLLLNLRNVLEAGENVVALYAEALGNCGQELAGDDGLHDVLLAVKLPKLFPAPEDVVCEEAPSLVAGELDHLAFVVADGYAKAVCVRVCGQDKVCAGFIGLCKGHGHGGGFLRIGRCHSGEIAVRHFLLRNVDNIGEADALESLRHQAYAAAVEGRVNNFEVCMLFNSLRGKHQGELVLEVALVNLCSHNLDGGFGLSGDGFEADIGRVSDFANFIDDILVHGSGNLAAVLPEHLVSVVFLGVVAGGYHDSGSSLLEANAVAELRSGPEVLKQVHLDAVVGKDFGRYFRKKAGIVAAVVADAHAGGTLYMSLDVVCKALGGHAHGILVHAVCTSAHDSSEATGTKLQITVKSVFQAHRVRFHKVLNLCLGFSVKVSVNPALSYLLEICHSIVSFSCYSHSLVTIVILSEAKNLSTNVKIIPYFCNMEFREFILLHDGQDIASLALQRSRLSKDVEDWDLALSTLQARSKLKSKLPSWYAIPSLHYPLPLSAEQCSSEETANYKAIVLKSGGWCCVQKTVPPTAHEWEGPIYGRDEDGVRGFRNTTPATAKTQFRIADLTGGLGVDAWAFSKIADKVLYNEMKPELVKAAEHNFKELGVDNVVISNHMVEKGKVKEVLDGFEPDVLFLDPARRDEVGRKVFMLEDCSPNVLELLPELYDTCPQIMLKLSPMADITAVCRQLPGVKEVHVVEADGECKELLLMLEKDYEGEYGLYLYANGAVSEIPCRARNEEKWTENGDGNVLFVPGKGLMKTGAFWWPETFGMKQLAASTHMYAGDAKVPELEPFGKFYTILETAPLNNRSIKEIGKKYPEADVTARNIPMTSDELRKRLGVKPSGGSVHIFGTQCNSDKMLIICRATEREAPVPPRRERTSA